MIAASGYGWTDRGPKALKKLMIKADNKFTKLIKKEQIQAIAFSGSSGAALAFPLALKHELPVIYVRKAGEKSHGYNVEFNGTGSGLRYIIVDDFIDTGSTVERIYKKVQKEDKAMVCAGVFLYDDSVCHGDDYPINSKIKLKIFGV